MRALDLFAGPGGWDVALADLDVDVIGVEWDESACATRRAAGHRTLRADVAELDPAELRGCELQVASAPCPAFSAAGKRAGVRDLHLIYDCAAALVDGTDTRREVRSKLSDKSALLVVEPLRFALVLRPAYIAWEQVPPVLPFWRECGRMLERLGYSTWAGCLSSEQYGVPQTRERAFLMARLDGVVVPPPATHQAYEPGVPAREQLTLAGSLRPWVSMAEAIGQTATPRSREVLHPAGCGDPLQLKGDDWPERRPATTIAGDSRVFQPGGHHAPGQQSVNSIRISVEDAAVLQGFPRDYPFRGTRSKRFEQVGNAVPPPMARAVLEALLGAS